MDSPLPKHLRSVVAATLLALLVGCAGTAPRAESPQQATFEPGAVATAEHPAAQPTRPDAAAEDTAGTATTSGDASALSVGGHGDSASAAKGDAAGAEASYDPTQAELDFAAIYGGDVYDPVADPTLPAPAQVGAPGHDPWETWNRRVHGFNMAVDRTVAEPLARAYVKVVPRPVRLGVGTTLT